MEANTWQSLLGALAVTVALALLHLAAPRIRKLPLVPESAMASFAGGLAAAYVFLHLLPEIAEGNEAIGEALSDVLRPTPLVELGIFLVALVGFVVFYGLERAARKHGAQGEGPRELSPAGVAAAGRVGRSAPGRPAGPEASAGRVSNSRVYVLHLGSFMVYNALITYTMPLRLRTGLLFALLFAVAMGLHFVLTDRGLEEHYPDRFDSRGRFALAGALFFGWLAALLFAPTSTLVVAILTALLGGSILLNVFKEEIPSNRQSSFGWFMTGLTLYAVLLALVTALSE